MNFGAYFLDLLTRSFFVFVAAYLLVRLWWVALLISAGINVVYEMTVGKKQWQQLRARPPKPRRHWRDIAKAWWQRLFDRRRTKGLVWAGIIILFMSWVVPMNTYYIVCACVVFGLAAISRFAPPVKTATIPCETNPVDRTTNCPPPSAE